jgi:DNA modification methylase
VRQSDFHMTSGCGGFSDSGSIARYFYSSKASTHDRRGSDHPTVKPVELMQWLVKLVTPRGGLVLDPFAGSGTTGDAARIEGRDAILIEAEPRYVADIERRLAIPAMTKLF